MSSKIEASAVVGTSDGVSLVLWDTFGRRCRVTMRCDAMRACMGTRFRTGRCIRVHLYTDVAATGPEGLRAHRAGTGFYTHTYAVLLTRT